MLAMRIASISPFSRALLLGAALCPIKALAQGTRAPTPPANLTADARYDRAISAWDAGRFDAALEDLRALATGPDAAAWNDRIAELTGEIWKTREIARDARAPRWSPDGRHLAYATGTNADPRFVVTRVDRAYGTVAEGAGPVPQFMPDGSAIVYAGSSGDGAVAIRTMRLDGSAPVLSRLDATAAVAATPFGVGTPRLAVISGAAGDSASQLQLRAADGAWTRVPTGDLQPIDIIRSPDGARVVVVLGRRGPFARTAGGNFSQRQPVAFAEFTDGTAATIVNGTAPAFSRDGSAIAWLVADSTTARIHVRRGATAPTVVAAVPGTPPVFALSPDGSQVAFQQVVREDLEIFTVPSDASSPPRRLTREIQHDLLPQYLSGDRLLATIGEARHRRSHLYDLRTGARTRLFHNNSVRTVAPEYEWVASPDGSRVAIVAERDGDTVTPHRHLYVTDLSTKWSPAELVARLDSNLTAERALRANGERIFAPIAAAVREATEAVDVSRIYGYEKALFGFDSKHIFNAGNRPATEWLLAKYRSFGLETRLQPFSTPGQQGQQIEVANVIATVPGTVNPELVYVVGAHFDSHLRGPGADDNTSGTAMILEAARVLSTRPQPATVMFVAFTGEEGGLRGAREFGRRMKDSITVVGALNNDMMGWSNDHRMDNTIRYSNPGIRDVQHAASIGFSRLTTYDAFYYKSTDAHALFDAWGDIVGGIGSYPILGNPHYHQPHDVLETINHQQLAETSRTTVATIMLLASSPSRLTGLAATGQRATWTAAREKGVTRYLVRWGPAGDPLRHSATVTTTEATLRGALPGWRVAVKAVNERGLEGWDWARAEVQ
jgi:Tol biopolymer transport system component